MFPRQFSINFIYVLKQVLVYLTELYDDCYKMYENDFKNSTACYDLKSDDDQNSLQLVLDSIKEQALSKVWLLFFKMKLFISSQSK